MTSNRGTPGETPASNRVSIIIPCRDRAHYLAEAIESAQTQTLPPWEILVVDDGSSEDLFEVCQRYPGVRCVRQPHRGVSTARNLGASLASADLLMFLDSDDRLLPNALEAGVRAMAAHPEAAFVFGACRYIDADGSLMGEGPGPVPPVATYATMLRGDHLLAPAGRIVRRSAFEAVGGFEVALSHGEDTDLWLRIARSAPIHFHGGEVFEYRVHGENASRNGAKMLLGMMKVQRRQYPFVRSLQSQECEASYRAGERRVVRMFGPWLPYQVARHVKSFEPLSALLVLALSLRYDPRSMGAYARGLTRRLLDEASRRGLTWQGAARRGRRRTR